MAKNWSDSAKRQWPPTERKERLEYMADLLRELEALAEQEGCLKLPSTLAVARAEALIEALKESA